MTTSQIHPYLFFDGRTEEAIEFYTAALGAKLAMLMRFDEAPDAPPPGMLPEGWEKKVMHSAFHIGESMVMASDGCGGDGGEGNCGGFALSVTLPDEAAALGAFAALSEGGTVTMPIGKTFWSPCFGMVQDRFGVKWMVTVPENEA